MKAKHIISRLFLLPLLAAAALTSCISEEIQVDVPRGNAREMVFKISVSGGTPHQTRGIAEGSANDNALHDLLFLQFGSDDKLLPDADGYSIISANLKPETGADAPIANTYTVRVALHVDARKALVVANWGAFKGGTTPTDYLIPSLQGKTITEIAEGDDLFEYLRGGKDFTTTHPYHLMGSQPFTIPPVGTTATVPLIRSLAKINVTVASNLTVTGSAGEGGQLTAANGFKLKTIQLVNANGKARVLPPTSTTAGAQNIPTNPNKGAGYFDGEDVIIYSGFTYNPGGVTSLIDSIFLPEVKITGNPDNFTGSTDWLTTPALLIEATMNLDGTPVDRWFRVNLRMADATDGGKLKHVDILRNHKYTVNITGIGGMGYKSSSDAFANLPGDLIVSLTATEEDPDLTNIVYDGQHYLASNAPFEYDGAEHDGTLKLFTDYVGGWKIESIAGNDDGWLTGSDIAIGSNGDDNTVAALNFHVAANASGNPRTAVITVSAGTLRQEVEVRQGTSPATTLTVTPLYHTFEWDAFSTGTPAKTFTVTTDGAWTASITNVSPDAATNFTLTAGTGVTISGTGTATIISGTGNGSFSVLPKSNTTNTKKITITVTATGATAPEAAPKTVIVRQWLHSTPSMLAAPGVIGYIQGTNQLTIRGSKEFLGSMVMTDPNNLDIKTSTALATREPLENASVYMAKFKFGSLVALRENYLFAADIYEFSLEQVLATPSQWSGTITTDWASIPVPTGMNDGQELSTNTTAVPANGMGDPCDYWFGEEGYGLGDGNASTGNGWKLPTMGKIGSSHGWYPEGGYPFGDGIVSYNDNIVVFLNTTESQNAGLPMIGRVSGRETAPDWSMFLPIGDYYSSTSAGFTTVESAYRMKLPDDSSIYHSITTNINDAAFVRCVKPPRTAKAAVDSNGGGSATVKNTTGTVAAQMQAFEGEHMVFTATPNTNYLFDKWTATGYTLSPSEATTTPLDIVMPNNDVTFTASFKPRTVQWIFIADGTLTLPENGYYHIEGWGGDGGAGGNAAGPGAANGGASVPAAKQVAGFTLGLSALNADNVLYIQVGTAGQNGTNAINSASSSGQAGGAGGKGTYFGNGGNGGTGGNGVSVNSGGGGGGGGGAASGVLRFGTAAPDVFFAAGGSGGSGAAGGSNVGGTGTVSSWTPGNNSETTTDGASGGDGIDGGLTRRGAGGGGGGGGGSDLSVGGGGYRGLGGTDTGSVAPGKGGYAGESSCRLANLNTPSEFAPYAPNNTRPAGRRDGYVVITLIRTK